MKTITEKSLQCTKLIREIARFCFLFLLLASIQLYACLSFADSSTETMLVSAEVKSSCVINASNVHFGVYDPAGANQSSPLNVSNDIKLKCIRGTSAQVSIDAGAHYGKASTNTRSMVSADGAAYLAYELYKDQSETKPWDSNTKVEKYADITTDININFYAKIPANQNVPDGAYSDVLTVTVTY